MSRQLTGKISKRRNHSTHATHEGQASDQTEEADPALWDEARRKGVFDGKQPRRQDGQDDAKAACSQHASAVGFQEEAEELGHALETWSDTAAQYWVSVGRGRKSQILLSGKFATLRMKLAYGETSMPLGCVILEGGGNVDLRSRKAFGLVNAIRRVSPEFVPTDLHTG